MPPKNKYNCVNCNEEFTNKRKFSSHVKQCKATHVSTSNNDNIDSDIDDDVISDIELEEQPKIKNDKKKGKKKESIKKLNKKPKNKKVKRTTDFSILRLPTNKIVYQIEQDPKHKEIYDYIKSKIKQAHDILYNSENIEGEGAMNDIMNLLYLWLLFDNIDDKGENGKIDLLNKSYYKRYKDDALDNMFKYFDMVKLSKATLSELRSDKSNDIIKQIGYILKTHPITGQIFKEENFMRTEKATTLQYLINTMFINGKTKWDKNKLFEIEDVIGEIYESFINNYVKSGSKLGQYFTPRKMMFAVLDYLKDDIIEQFKNDEKVEVFDPCMGTGGWLVIFYNMFIKTIGNILLSGNDVKQNTFQLGLMNIMTTTHKPPEHSEKDNSLTHIDKHKYTLIATNPPFKTDFKFEQLKENFEEDDYNKNNNIKLDDVYKLKDNNPPIQFLELDIFKLEDGGKCIIVLPYGELFFSERFADTRKHWLDIIDITHIILCPSGVFTHTGIKTCIMVFNKNKIGTKEITYLKIDKGCTSLTEITKIKKEDIMKEKNYSLYVTDYLEDRYINNLMEKIPQFEWVEFGKVFTLEKGKLQSSKVEEDENGDGILINWSMYDNYKKINNYELDGENLFISTSMPNGNDGGYMVIKYHKGKCSYVDLMSRCIINEKYKNTLSLKYIHYFLRNIKNHIELEYEKGSCNKSLDMKNFNRMKIPIPPIDIQNEICAYYDVLNNILKYQESAKEFINTSKMICLEMEIKISNNNKYEPIYTKIGDVCNFKNGKTLTIETLNSGMYPVIGGGDKPFGYHNKYNMEEKTILCASSGNAGYISRYLNKVWASDCFGIISNTEILTNDYLYYYLKLIQKPIYNHKKGIAQEHIDSCILSKFDIIIPNKKRQNDIINQMESFDNKIDNINKEINETQNIINTTFFNYLNH